MYQFPFGRIHLILALEDAPPFDPDALVYEQDTALLLDTDNEIRSVRESNGQLIENMLNQEPLPLGSVLVRDGYPFEFLAIIHDVERDPICEELSVIQALFNIMEASEDRELGSLAMPLLGTVFGSFSPLRAASLVKAVLPRTRPNYLNSVQIWLPDEKMLPVLFEFFRQATA